MSIVGPANSLNFWNVTNEEKYTKFELLKNIFNLTNQGTFV